MNIVLDTNVLLSAAFFAGTCDRVLAHCLTSPEIQLVLSNYILREFVEHGVGKLHGSNEQVRTFAGHLRQQCVLVEPTALPADACNDPDDVPVLGTAVAGAAEWLVTGDRALLAMQRYQSVTLISPRTFYEQR